MRNRAVPDSNWSDAELVRAYQAGVEKAWDIICLRHQKKLRGFFLSKGIRNPEDIEDLVQETLHEAMQNIAQFKNPESFSWWLKRVAVGTMGRWLKKQDRRREFQNAFKVVNELAETGELYTPTNLEPERKTINKEYLEIVFSLMEQFPPSEKETLQLKLEGMAYTEIAEKLEINVNAAKTRVSKARKRLRTWLKAKYPEVHEDLVNRGII